jgi:hypothetical protein
MTHPPISLCLQLSSFSPLPLLHAVFSRLLHLRTGPGFYYIYQLGSDARVRSSLPTASELIFYENLFCFRTHLDLEWWFQVL